MGRRFPDEFDLDTPTDDDLVFAYDATTGTNKKFQVSSLRGAQGEQGEPGPPGALAGVYFQEYPPNAGTGERWIIPSLEHIAVWSGSEWVAEQPTADVNLCCILGDFVGIWDAASGSGDAANLGTGGSALDGTLTGVTVTTLGGHPVWSFNGTTDYITVADNALLDIGASDDFTAVAIVEQAAFSDNENIFTKRATNAATVAGWQIKQQASTNNNKASVLMGDGAAGTTVVGPLMTVDTIHVLMAERDTAADLIRARMDASVVTGVDATTGSLDSTLPLRMGATSASTPSSYWSGTGYWYGVLRRLLTDDERIVLRAWKAARWS